VNGRLGSLADLHEAIVHGAVKRVRPKMMTVAAAMMGLMPIMWSTGAGADVMKRVAAPMVGGLATSFLMELLVYPAIYLLWKRRAQVEHTAKAASPPSAPAEAVAGTLAEFERTCPPSSHMMTY
jgi:copper/silver efflux system protein